MGSKYHNDAPPLAYDIRGLMKATGRGRTGIFDDIKAGRLKARKTAGKITVLYEDARAWLQSLPVHDASKTGAS